MQAAQIAPLSSPLIFTPKLIPVTKINFRGYNRRITATIKNQQRVSVDHHRAEMAAAAAAASVGTAPKWAQKTITLPAQRRGCHLITSKILKEIGQDLSGFKCGLAHFFLQHTSASLTVNENYDSDVRDDTETFLNKVVPEGRSAPWKHTLEGPDDMPAHIKSSMFGCSLTIPITDGKLNMGTWQGIWLCEHRDAATPRKVVVTLNGI
ncbi:thiamine-phosphate pyrophosphorylase [Handroanthus impetiginosus]|uniref:Thiamine-phosphate pyrophosphorylase n=1 Tax=Handroanthus impetiginosus TaxID=429701 RepID=A0A2G9GPC6_9LAMI|nr:thiamine-phosphate pyrophosphorylase [Handroanthus impetiginosus]